MGRGVVTKPNRAILNGLFHVKWWGYFMALLLDGNSEIGAHSYSEISNLICSRNLFKWQQSQIWIWNKRSKQIFPKRNVIWVTMIYFTFNAVLVKIQGHIACYSINNIGHCKYTAWQIRKSKVLKGLLYVESFKLKFFSCSKINFMIIK